MDFTFREEGIKEGALVRFYDIHPSALQIYVVLMAYASEKTKIAKITIKTMCRKTGFSSNKVVGILDRLKDAGFIEAPLEGERGKSQIYEIKYMG